MRKINPIDQNCVECENGKMKIQNEMHLVPFKGGKDPGGIQVAIWQLGHQHRGNLVPRITLCLALFDLPSFWITLHQIIAKSLLQSVLHRQLKGKDWTRKAPKRND